MIQAMLISMTLRLQIMLEDEDESDNKCNVIETSCYSCGYAGEMSGMA